MNITHMRIAVLFDDGFKDYAEFDPRGAETGAIGLELTYALRHGYELQATGHDVHETTTIDEDCVRLERIFRTEGVEAFARALRGIAHVADGTTVEISAQV